MHNLGSVKLWEKSLQPVLRTSVPAGVPSEVFFQVARGTSDFLTF